MTIDLYSFHMSPFCRSVLSCFKELGIEYNLKSIDLSKKEQFSPEFLKINPAHLIPTIVDNDFVLWESRVIMQYLCNKYAPESTLYPKDPKKRAIVDRWLTFDVSLLSSMSHMMSQLFLNIEPPPQKLENFKNSMKLAEQLIGDNKYLTGDDLTIGDLALMATTRMLSMGPFESMVSEYPNFKRWLKTVETLPYFDEIYNSGTKEDFMAFVANNQEYLTRKLSEF